VAEINIKGMPMSICT